MIFLRIQENPSLSALTGVTSNIYCLMEYSSWQNSTYWVLCNPGIRSKRENIMEEVVSLWTQQPSGSFGRETIVDDIFVDLSQTVITFRVECAYFIPGTNKTNVSS